MVVSELKLFFFIARSDEMFASSAGGVHPAHCLTRNDVALFAGGTQLDYRHWRRPIRWRSISGGTRGIRIRLEMSGFARGRRLVDRARDTEQTAVQLL